MPYKNKADRKYANAVKYEAQPEQVKNRSARDAARDKLMKAGKVKKGEIADSTAEQVKSAAQNTTSGVFALPSVTKRCKIEPLTKEMKAAKIYIKLRQTRINARYNGKRIKAAKDAEAAKK